MRGVAAPKNRAYGDMSELVDESDLKSAEPRAREGSSPSIPTIQNRQLFISEF